MKLFELKDKLNSLTDEQLKEDAVVFIGESEVGSMVDSWDEQGEDIYYMDGDCYGGIKEVQEFIDQDKDPDEPLTIDDFRKVPKGFFTLHAEEPVG